VPSTTTRVTKPSASVARASSSEPTARDANDAGRESSTTPSPMRIPSCTVPPSRRVRLWARPHDVPSCGRVAGVDLDAFTAVHRPEWDRLDRLAKQRRLDGAEADELVRLYQAVATHL